MKCSNCGNEIKSGIKFCNFCGAKINNQGQITDRIESETETSCESRETYSREVVKKKSSKGSVFLITFLVIAILGCVVALCYVFYNYGATNGYDADTDISADYDDEEDEENEKEEEKKNKEKEEEREEPEEDVDKKIQDDDYFFPSERVLITESDLRGKTKSEVAFIRNEIYARHGYIFNTEEYSEYFGSKDWYYPNPYFSESVFNETEKANKEFLVAYEMKMGWR